MIGASEIAQRIESLKVEHAQHVARMQAVSGAIQECENWLAHLRKLSEAKLRDVRNEPLSAVAKKNGKPITHNVGASNG